MSLDQKTILELLVKDQRKGRGFDNPRSIAQNGPLRWFDYEMRCSSLGCNSPTYCKVEYVPRCNMHALKELNQIAINLTP
jgi:hypothetical protein